MIDNAALLSELYSIQGSYSIEPAAIDQTDKRCIIDVKERTINIPVEIESLGVQYDHRSYKLLFEIDRYVHGVDLLTQTCVIQWLSKNGTTERSGLHPVVEIEAIDNDKLLFVWELYEDETRIPGTILFAVNFYTMKDENSFLWSYNTLPASSTIKDTLDVVINPSDEITPSLLMVWNDKMVGIERLAHDSVSTSSRSAHEAEAWAHGRIDFPNTMLDNAKYYKDLTQALYDEAKDALSEEKDRVVEEAKDEIVNLAKDEVIAVVKNEVTDDVINDVYAAKNDSIAAINDTTTSAIQDVEQSRDSAINDLLATGDQRYAVKGSIPTKVSELENDSNYLTEVPEAPVKSVNGKTGDVDLSAEDVGAVASEEFAEFKVDYDNHSHTAEEIGAATSEEVIQLKSDLDELEDGGIIPEMTDFIICNRQYIEKDKIVNDTYYSEWCELRSATGYKTYPPIKLKAGTYGFLRFDPAFTRFKDMDGVISNPLTTDRGIFTIEKDGYLYITFPSWFTENHIGLLTNDGIQPSENLDGVKEYNVKIPQLIVDSQPIYNRSYVIVEPNGTCDFENIQDALDNVNDSPDNHIVILVMAGTYPRFTTKNNGNHNLRNVSIVGVSRDYCIIKDNSGNYQTPPAEIRTNGVIRNLSFVSTNEEFESSEGQNYCYAVHMDFDHSKTRFENCYLYSENGPAMGVGLYYRSDLQFDNCEFITNQTGENGTSGLGAFYCHSRGEANTTNQRISLNNCRCINKTGKYGACYHELVEGTTQNLVLTNNIFFGNVGKDMEIRGTWQKEYSFGNNCNVANAD